MRLEWSLFFSNDLVIFSHFNVTCVDPELRPGAEFPHPTVTAGNLMSVSRQQPLFSCCPEKRRNQPHEGRSRLLFMGFWFAASTHMALKLDRQVLRNYLKLTCEYELYILSNTKVGAAKDRDENYMNIRPQLVRHF